MFRSIDSRLSETSIMVKSHDSSIFLIPSTNGLGHARRLIHLVKYWNEFKRIKLLLSPKQNLTLKSEINDVLASNFEVKIILYEGFGLDGYAHLSKPSLPEFANPTFFEDLHKASIVISDNCIWPLQFRSDCIIFGHFLWHDVFKKEMQIGNVEFREVMDREQKLLERIKYAIGLKQFSFGEFDDITSDRKISFPLYYEYKKEKPRENEIWYASGTTGMNRIERDSLIGDGIVFKESFELNLSDYLPQAIIGRPGLGTLRDCIEWNVPFGPLYSGQDVELWNNERVIQKYCKRRTSLTLKSAVCEVYEFESGQFIRQTSYAEFANLFDL